MSLNPLARQAAEQAASLQQAQEIATIRKAQQKKALQEDVIQKEEQHPFVSQFIAPTSTLWAAPQLVKSLYIGEQPATEAEKDLAKLPPPPLSIQRFAQTLQQIKGTNLPSYRGVEGSGEAEFLAMSAKIKEKGGQIVNKSMNESLDQQNIALVTLEEVNDLANDLIALEGQLANLEAELATAKADGSNSSAAEQRYSSLLNKINQALEDGAVTYYTKTVRILPHGGGPVTIFNKHTFHGDATAFLAFKDDHPSNRSRTACHYNGASPSVAKYLSSFMNEAPSKALIALEDLENSVAVHKANAASYANQVKQLRGETIQRFIIPGGHTATFEKKFPNPPYKIVTNMNGTVEVLFTPGQGLETISWTSFVDTPMNGPHHTTYHAKVNRFTEFCKQNGWAIPPNAIGQTIGGLGNIGLIPDKQEAIQSTGELLCKLLGWPPGKIDFNDIQAALALAKLLQKYLKKILETLNEKGDGLAVFTAMQNAISQAQQHNQQIIASSEQKTSNTNLQMLDQLQQFADLMAKDLSEIDQNLNQIQSATQTLSTLQDVNYASLALGVLSMVLTVASFFLPIIAPFALGIGITGGLLGAATSVASGVIQVELGEMNRALSNEQKDFTSDRAYVQHTQASSNLYSQMTSSTTQTIQQIVQRQVDIEKDVMQMYNTASQIVSSSSHI